MSQFTVKKGYRYRCSIRLSWVESFASNEDIAERLVGAGFINVDVTGHDYQREAEGTWPLADASAELPEQIVRVDEINEGGAMAEGGR